MPISREELQAIVSSIWLTFVGVEVTALDGDEHLDRARGPGALVYLRGAWEGAVSLTCEPPLATRLAAVMLAVDAAEVGPDAARDALGELANVLGGNVKNLLPAPCFISLPTAQGPGSVDPPTVGSLAAAFSCFGEVFVVRVVAGARPSGSSVFPRDPDGGAARESGP